ncbi:MAG: 30S ribosomal protein S7 [Christensenellaceae bacterium]|jgi:small subunit ribosomal protein S7|nr:30S ribosomal protein S7 [Christensenellaceae bacterium]
MSRRAKAEVRQVLPDPVYKSTTITKLINQVMEDGKKGIAQKIVYGALTQLNKKTNIDAMSAFSKVMENVMPLLETKARRVGGSNYQVPMEVRPERRQTLAIRWLVASARKRTERGMENCLAAELNDAYNQTGGAVKKREEMYRMAEANKAFANYKW